jgi:hypothetical protein
LLGDVKALQVKCAAKHPNCAMSGRYTLAATTTQGTRIWVKVDPWGKVMQGPGSAALYLDRALGTKRPPLSVTMHIRHRRTGRPPGSASSGEGGSHGMDSAGSAETGRNAANGGKVWGKASQFVVGSARKDDLFRGVVDQRAQDAARQGSTCPATCPAMCPQACPGNHGPPLQIERPGWMR